MLVCVYIYMHTVRYFVRPVIGKMSKLINEYETFCKYTGYNFRDLFLRLCENLTIEFQSWRIGHN